MKFEFKAAVFDDDGSQLSEHEISVQFPMAIVDPTIVNEAKNLILGEGQINISKMAEQASMHCIWHAAKILANRQEALDNSPISNSQES